MPDCRRSRGSLRGCGSHIVFCINQRRHGPICLFVACITWSINYLLLFAVSFLRIVRLRLEAGFLDQFGLSICFRCIRLSKFFCDEGGCRLPGSVSTIIILRDIGAVFAGDVRSRAFFEFGIRLLLLASFIYLVAWVRLAVLV